MTDPTRLGLLARFADQLPQRGRMGRTALVIAALLAAVVLISKLVEDSAGPALVYVQAGMIVLGLMLFGLAVLMQWRFVVGRAGIERHEQIPGLWRLFLLPYGKNDVAYMLARGRLAELMTLSVMAIVCLGLVLAITLPR